MKTVIKGLVNQLKAIEVGLRLMATDSDDKNISVKLEDAIFDIHLSIEKLQEIKLDI